MATGGSTSREHLLKSSRSARPDNTRLATIGGLEKKRESLMTWSARPRLVLYKVMASIPTEASLTLSWPASTCSTGHPSPPGSKLWILFYLTAPSTGDRRDVY